MKTLLLLLVSAPSFAVTLEKFQAVPGGVDRVIYNLTGSGVTQNRGTNFFDHGEYRIGNLEAKADSIGGTRQSLEALSKKLEAVDAFLKKDQEKSFNDLAGPPGHSAVYILDGRTIHPESKYYAELDKAFTALTRLKWSQTSGYELSKDLSRVMVYEDSKVKTTSEYSKDTYCDRANGFCTYLGGGRVFVKGL